MAFRDIDSSVRITGAELSLPSGSITVGSNINLLNNGSIEALSFVGNGSGLTNLSSSAMSDVLKLNGTRSMTGMLKIERSGSDLEALQAGASDGYISIKNWTDHNSIQSSLGTLTISNTADTDLTTINMRAQTTVFTGAVNALQDIQLNGSSISTLFEPKGTLHDDRYYTETEMDGMLSEKIGYGEVLMNTNHFGGKELYINSINNAMFRAESRWQVTGTMYNADGTVADTVSEGELYKLFDGNYESNIHIPAGMYIIIHVLFNGGNFPGYPYGNFYLSHYNTNHSESAKLRVYCNYEPHGIGWHEVNFVTHMENGTYYIAKARNGKYNISEIEFEIHAPDLEDASITQIEWQLDRPGDSEMPVVDKYRENSMYSDLHFKDITNTVNAMITKDGEADFSSLTVEGVSVSLSGHSHAWGDITDKPTAFPVESHNHDDRYYTEAEIDTKLSGKSNTGHTHDDRYYTESEIETKLSGKSNTGHVHSWGEITSKPSTFPPSTHNHNSMYLALDGSSMMSGNLNVNGYKIIFHDEAIGNVDHIWQDDVTNSYHFVSDGAEGATGNSTLVGSGFERTDGTSVSYEGHTHDGRYYTEAEIDTKLSGKSDTGHTHTFGSLTSKPTTLSGYGITDAATSAHNHDGVYVNTSGDSMTGNLVFVSSLDGIKWSMNTDGASITFKNDGDSDPDSYLHFETSDNGDEYFKFSQDSVELLTIKYDNLRFRGNIVWHSGNFSPSSKADKTITISGGSGLLGGGSLATDQTLSVDFAGTGTATTVSRSDHNHDSSYLGVNAKASDSEKLDGLDSSQFVRSDASDVTKGNHVFYSEDTTGVYSSAPIEIREVAMAGSGQTALPYAPAITFHWGGRKQAQIALESSGVMVIRDGNMHSTLRTLNAGNLQINGQNLDDRYEAKGASGNYVKQGVSDQSVGSNFTIDGTTYIGDSNTTGDVIINGVGGDKTIHLDGGSEGKISSSSVKSYISGSGNADFKGTVTVNKLQVTDMSAPLVTNLNADYLNGVRAVGFAQNASVLESVGYGVHEGMEVVAHNPPSSDARVNAGTVYTSSGRRIHLSSYQSVGMPAASETYDRIDSIVVEGKSSGNNDGRIIVVKGYAAASPVPPSRAAVGEDPNTDPARPKIPYDAVLLAHIYRRTAVDDVTDGTDGTYDAIEDQREYRDINYSAGNSLTANVPIYSWSNNGFNENGTWLKDKYAQLNKTNVFNGNQIVSGRVELISSGTIGGDPNSAEYGLKISNGSSGHIVMDANEIIGTDEVYLTAGSGYKLILNGNMEIENGKPFKAEDNAVTLTIPAGERSVTWTHSYGGTSYAVNLTTNSFERHIRWKDKTANTITIEIDDPSSEEILVDCILIGY